MPSSPNQSTDRALIEEAPLGIFEVDRDGQFIDLNPAACEMVGYSREELLDRSITDLHPSTENLEHQDDLLGVQESGNHRFERILLDREGHEVDVLIDAVPIGDRIVGYVQEITDQKEYEQELEEQRNNLEILNQVVRHDIRNKLQLVLAYADLLRTEVGDGDEEYVEQVLDAARDAVEITTTARDVTEVMLQSDVDHHPVRLRSVIEGEVEDVRSNYDSALVRLDGPLPSVEVLADDMLASVFRNLLTNAIQHNDKEIPEVTVSATEDDGDVLVRVADNGPGIPDERKEEIFQQGEVGLDSDGVGLGLYLVDTLVGRYGGDVRVEDNDPDGSIFLVKLPIAEDA